MQVWTCPTGNQGAIRSGALGTGPWVPTCSSGQAWTEIESGSVPFDPMSIDPATATAAMSAGFISLGVGLLLAYAVRIIISAVKNG